MNTHSTGMMQHRWYMIVDLLYIECSSYTCVSLIVVSIIIMGMNLHAEAQNVKVWTI